MKLNEQIAFLRKEKGVTQEELAQALGVSNQSVSKWESAQCCPDIGLLPDLAAYFSVSVDELMGYKGTDTSKDLVLQFRTAIESLPKGEDFALTLKLAYILHAVLMSKYMIEHNIKWDAEEAIKTAGDSSWGLSCAAVPEMTTYMLKGTVYFSNNRDFCLDNRGVRNICDVMKTFSDSTNMKTFAAIYELTVHDENAHTSIEKIAEKCGLPEEKVANSIENGIYEYLHEKTENGDLLYRIEGRYMCLLSALAMLRDVK